MLRIAVSGCGGDCETSAAWTIQACPSPETPTSCGRLRRTRMACPRGSGRRSASRTIAPPSRAIWLMSSGVSLSKIIHSESARTNTAAGVGDANGIGQPQPLAVAADGDGGGVAGDLRRAQPSARRRPASSSGRRASASVRLRSTLAAAAGAGAAAAGAGGAAGGHVPARPASGPASLTMSCDVGGTISPERCTRRRHRGRLLRLRLERVALRLGVLLGREADVDDVVLLLAEGVHVGIADQRRTRPPCFRRRSSGRSR